MLNISPVYVPKDLKHRSVLETVFYSGIKIAVEDGAFVETKLQNLRVTFGSCECSEWLEWIRQPWILW